MDIEEVLKELDSLPGGENSQKTGEFIEDKIRLAHEEGDSSAELTLINEMIGYCRYTGRHDDSKKYGEAALLLCKEQGLYGQLPYATTLLNFATADRAAGRYEKSLARYKEVMEIYNRLLNDDDYLYAALYNNMSLLYQETGRNEESAEYLKKALDVISGIDERRVEQAITLTNLGQAYIRCERYDDAADKLEMAEDIFEELGGDDFHYPGCLNAIGQLNYLRNEFPSSVRYYKKALKLLKRHVGEDNPACMTVLDNLKQAENKLDGGKDTHEEVPDVDGITLSRKFYEEYGRPMIYEKFREFKDCMTVGLAGRGSQCYGFDDDLSRDHDFGPDFCIWLDDDVYDEIGDSLQKAYDDLPSEYMGYKRVTSIPPDGKRVGVIRTKEFYSRILDIEENRLVEFMDTEDPGIIYDFFASVKEENLSQCTNGCLFGEGQDDFIKLRNKLSYYPDTLWKRKIAEELHYSAQMGQYNYIRMLKRGEKVASEIALAGYMEHTMKLVYLINRKYAPYYKWLHRGMADLEKAAVIMDIFNAVYDMPKGDERIRMTTEIVAGIIIEELERIGMAGNVPPQERFLDVYSQVINKSTL
ncbi:MAG: DUF4037 domain-containing protein [Lachnospiraceae bacterium]|nr:DUF4037 domain-containing protein [Lachnospiraceae bacterium]